MIQNVTILIENITSAINRERQKFQQNPIAYPMLATLLIQAQCEVLDLVKVKVLFCFCLLQVGNFLD